MTDPLDELKTWLDATWDPAMSLREWWKVLAESGWGYPHFPRAWYGRDLEPAVAGAASRVLHERGAPPAPSGFGGNMAAPTLLDHGTDDQRARLLPGIVTGEEAYCQLFSEPGAGSDLAGLQCRAERDGDTYVVNGQKVWTTGAQIATKAMLLARTNVDVPKHAGLSYFLIDVRQPGIEIRPIREMTGRRFFNEVFLTDARVPAADLIGGEGNGWAVANTTLAYERGFGGTGGVPPYVDPGPIAGNLDRPAGECGVPQGGDDKPGLPPPTKAEQLIQLAHELGRAGEPALRDQLVQLFVLERVAALNGRRGRALADRGQGLPGLPQLHKIMQNHVVRGSQHATFAVLGAAGTLFGYEPDTRAAVEEATGIADLGRLVETSVFAAAPPIYGGSDQIQRNILGERVLGLPREPSDDRKVPFKDLPKN